MKVSELARAAGVTPDTVRHYVRIGLLEADRDPFNDYRRFGRRHLNRVRFVRNAVQLGFSLADIQQIFDEAEEGHSPCPRVRELLTARIDETRRRVAELQALQQRMEEALADWQEMPDSMPDGHSVCHLIESWGEGRATGECGHD